MLTNDIFADDNTLESIYAKDTFGMLEITSPSGRRKLLEFKPITSNDYERCIKHYKKIEKLMSIINNDNRFYHKLNSLLAHINDLMFTFNAVEKEEILEITQLYEIKQFMFFSRLIYKLLKDYKIKNRFPINPLDDLWKLIDIEKTETPGFYISNLYSKKLQEQRMYLKQIINEIQEEKSKTIKSIKEILNFNNPKETIVVSRMNKTLVDKLDESKLYVRIKQNYVNYTYAMISTQKQLDLEYKKELLMNKIREEEYKVRAEISSKIYNYIHEIKTNMDITADLDIKLAKAKYSIENECVIPNINKSGKVYIKDGRNIFIERQCENIGLEYQPVNIEFDMNTVLITGSNMGGKSSFLKTMGNFFMHLAYAIPIPAGEVELPLVDFIYFSVDSNGSEQAGLSSFGSEVYELNRFLNIEDKYGLYLIDEFARGTNPYEGEAFCTAVLDYLKNKNSITLCISHYSLPATLSGIDHFQVAGLSDIDKDKLRIQLEACESLKERLRILNKSMDYSLKRMTGKDAVPQEAIRVAELIGVDNDLLNKVKKIINENGRK